MMPTLFLRSSRASVTAFFSIVVCATAMPGQAAAQSPPDTGQPTLAQELSTAPKPGQTSATASVGGQIQDGRTGTESLGVNGMVAHTTEQNQLLRFDLTTVYAKYRPAEGQPYFVVENNQLATFTYMQPHGEKIRFFGMAGWRRDTILELDYRAWGEGGAGTLVFAKGTASAFVGGSFSAGEERRGSTATGGTLVMNVGILETFNYHINKLMSFEQWYKGHKDVTDTGNDDYTLNLTLLTKVTKLAGLKVSYNLQHDTLHPPTVSATQSQFMVGVQFSFATTPPAAKP